MATPRLLHLRVGQDGVFVKVYLVHPIGLSVVCLTTQNKYRLRLFAFNQCRALNALVQLKNNFTPLVISLGICLDDSGS